MKYISKSQQLNSNLPNKGRKEEKSLAKKYKLKPTLNSGAVNNDGDFELDNFIIENKHGYKVLLLHKWIKKINTQARSVVPNKGRIISFDSNNEKWAAIPFDDLMIIFNKLEEKKWGCIINEDI